MEPSPGQTSRSYPTPARLPPRRGRIPDASLAESSNSHHRRVERLTLSSGPRYADVHCLNDIVLPSTKPLRSFSYTCRRCFALSHSMRSPPKIDQAWRNHVILGSPNKVASSGCETCQFFLDCLRKTAFKPVQAKSPAISLESFYERTFEMSLLWSGCDEIQLKLTSTYKLRPHPDPDHLHFPYKKDFKVPQASYELANCPLTLCSMSSITRGFFTIHLTYSTIWGAIVPDRADSSIRILCLGPVYHSHYSG
jgi:hypothetical protein